MNPGESHAWPKKEIGKPGRTRHIGRLGTWVLGGPWIHVKGTTNQSGCAYRRARLSTGRKPSSVLLPAVCTVTRSECRSGQAQTRLALVRAAALPTARTAGSLLPAVCLSAAQIRHPVHKAIGAEHKAY